MKQALLTILMVSCLAGLAQKRPLEHQDFDTWKRISDRKISNDGRFVLYELAPGKGDHTLKIKRHSGEELITLNRGQSGSFTADSKYAVLTLKPALDTINHLRRIKTKEEDMPRDSLAIVRLSNGEVTRIPDIKAFRVPEEWPGYVFYQLAPPVKEKSGPKEEGDSTKTSSPGKEMNKDNGFHLVIFNLETQATDTIPYVTEYALARKESRFIYHTTGMDSTLLAGVYYRNLETDRTLPLTRHKKGTFKSLVMDEQGTLAAFLADLDTTKALTRNFQLRFWKEGYDSALVKADSSTASLPAGWLVSEHGPLLVSEDGGRLFFGTSPKALIQDTTLLEEEIIQVEIWNYQSGRLHTQQNAELEEDKKKNYPAVYDTRTDQVVQLGDRSAATVRLNDKLTGPVALGIDNDPYYKFISWEGYPLRQDLYSIDVSTGERKLVKENVRGQAQVSPGGKYAFWYSVTDTTWFVYSFETEEEHRISIDQSFADELNDVPDYPGPYGAAGWTENDESLLLYDRYDIWKYDPSSKSTDNLTNGRNDRIRYRYVDTDYEEEAIDPDYMLLSIFDEKSRSEGYSGLKNLKTLNRLIFEPFHLSGLVKARDSENILLTKENHEVFPDLLATDLGFKNPEKISDVNPEINDYKWGTVEMYSWTSLDGVALEGLLYKPEGFDPEQQYPMITYFYERNSDNLHRHWGAVPHRSIVNPTFYASRGYVVFIPDIVYTTGYPGKSCYNAVIPGVTSLIEQGYIDEKRLGVQGHSWGGYQTAYLVTQTDIFAAAEAGAVVSNMISAYGGIRWWTGLSRMFQYEHTQSRIGGTLWEYPLRYIENSPIFYVDRINTPLLLMHNDMDGHVPWYQGIEFFVALRRLNKPAWMLNYNNEPHWPTKWENIRDFNIRMQQFFDHYLLGAPQPAWMSPEGIPAVEKGINKGYELMER